MSQTRSALLCLGFLASSAASTTPLRAQSEPAPALALEWDAPADCPSSSDVLAETRRLLGGPPTPPPGESWTAHATVTHRGVWSVDLEVRTHGRQRRRLQAQTCRGLADATALILALMIDPGAVAARSKAGLSADGGASSDPGGPGAPEGDGLTGTTATPGARPVADASSQRTSRAPAEVPGPAQVLPAGPLDDQPKDHNSTADTPSTDAADGSRESAPAPAERIDPGALHAGPAPRLFLDVPISLEAGPVPAIEYGVGAAVGLRFGSFRLEASFTDWLRGATASVEQPEGAGGTFRMVSGALDVCYVVRLHRLELGPCVEIEAGQIEAMGRGVTHTTTSVVPWFAAGAGLFAAMNLGGGWAVPLHLDALVPLERQDFMLQNVASVVYRSSVVGGRLSTGLEYRF